MDEPPTVTVLEPDEQDPGEGARWAGAFLAGVKSFQTRRAYRRDLECWFAFCTAHQVHPFRGVRRTHLELYLRELEPQEPPPAPGTLYRRVATLSSWFRRLEDEAVTIGNPAARISRPHRQAAGCSLTTLPRSCVDARASRRRREQVRLPPRGVVLRTTPVTGELRGGVGKRARRVPHRDRREFPIDERRLRAPVAVGLEPFIPSDLFARKPDGVPLMGGPTAPFKGAVGPFVMRGRPSLLTPSPTSSAGGEGPWNTSRQRCG
jgi:hypothetical protein